MKRSGRVNLAVIVICLIAVVVLGYSLLLESEGRVPRRTLTLNNARQLVLACLNYEAEHQAFPTDIRAADGKPLLSWRVAILPFIEGQQIYEQFHLDEPWDSEHNRLLVEQMPKCFESFTVRLAPGMCNFLGVSGEGTMFGSEAVKLRAIKDGVANTVAIVEVDPERAVPWTQPADWDFDLAFPLRGLGNVRPSGFIAGFADGSMRVIKSDIDRKTWTSLLTIAGNDDPVGDY